MPTQFVFDHRSPYAYLSSTQLPTLPGPVEPVPVNILKVMKAVNNRPSPECPPKARYAGQDAARWARLYGVPFQPNAKQFAAMREGSFAGDLLSRVAVAALQAGVFEPVNAALFRLLWASHDEVLIPQARQAWLRDLNVEVDLWHQAESPEVHAQLEQNNQWAIEQGIFGVPSFVVEGELFFGNDRLEFVRRAMTGESL